MEILNKIFGVFSKKNNNNNFTATIYMGVEAIFLMCFLVFSCFFRFALSRVV